MLKMSYFFKLKMPHFRPSAQAGLSLLETAVGLIVVGFMVVPVMRTYKVSMTKEAFQGTYGTLSMAIDGINQYYASDNGAYPCPADLSLQEGDAGYGVASNCVLANIELCGGPTWFTTGGGICKTEDTNDAIIIGGLPFASLKMSDEDSFDSWKNKYIYAVTFRQTDNTTYKTDNGNIRIKYLPKDDTPEFIKDGTNTTILYDMFIFSTGESGVGGYTKKGQPLTACMDINIDPRYETENCDFDDVFFALHYAPPGELRTSAYSTVLDGSSPEPFFDDITNMQRFVPANTWYQHEDNPSYANIDFVLTQATKVGIGTTTPDDPYIGTTLMVKGDIQAAVTASPNGGHLESDSVCAENDADCFDPEIITGAVESMNCFSSNSYVSDDPSVVRAVKKLADSSVTCTNGATAAGAPIETDGEILEVDTSKFNPVPCPNDWLAIGIDANGDLKCIAP